MLHDAVKDINNSGWQCIPEQIGKLINSCIQDKQASRPSLRDAQVRIGSLIRLIDDDEIPADNPVVIMEMLSQIFLNDKFEYMSEDCGSTIVVDEHATGLNTRMALVPMGTGDSKLSMRITRSRMQHDHRSAFDKYISTKLDRAAARLRSTGFEDVQKDAQSNAAEVSGHIIRDSWKKREVKNIVDGLQSCRHELTIT